MVEPFLNVEDPNWEAFRLHKDAVMPENWPGAEHGYPQLQITQEIDSTLGLMNLSSSYYTW
jgi:hypothetical protein